MNSALYKAPLSSEQVFNIACAIDKQLFSKHKQPLLNIAQQCKPLYRTFDDYEYYFANSLSSETHKRDRLRAAVIRRNIRQGKCDYIKIVEHHYVLTDKVFEEGIINKEHLYMVTLTERIGVNISDQLVSNSLKSSIQDAILSPSMAEYPNRNYLINRFQYDTWLWYNHNHTRNYTIKKNGDMTYLPKGKHPIYSDNGNWESVNRQQIKIGRGLAKIMPYASQRAIELIGNCVRSAYQFTGRFALVSGEEIRELYHRDRYSSIVRLGSLGESCMRSGSCQDYFDMYVLNTKMLVAFDTDANIMGRAIVWENMTIDGDDGLTFMDRIYGSDVTIEAFKGYAREQGWYHKEFQSFNNETSVVCPDGSTKSARMRISVKGGYDLFPYLDTMKYTDDPYDSVIHLSNFDGSYSLTSTNGYLEDDDHVTLHNGTRCHIDHAGQIGDEWYHIDDIVWCEEEDCYEFHDDAIEVNGYYYTENSECVRWVESEGEYAHVDDCIYVESEGDYYLTDDTVYVPSTGTYEPLEKCKMCPITDEYCHEDNMHSVTKNGIEYHFSDNLTMDQIDKFFEDNDTQAA